MTNLEIVQCAYEAFGRGDVPALMSLLDPNVVWINPGPTSPAYFGTHRGQEAVTRNILGFLAENFRFEVFEPREFFHSAEKVVVLLRTEAVETRNGRRVDQDVVHVFSLRDGKIVEFRDFQNSYAVAEALASH